MARKLVNLAGIFPPVTTSFTKDGALALGKMAANLKQLCKTRLHGFVVLGSNGEFPFLTRTEKLELMNTCRENVPKDKIFIAGAGMESTASTLELCAEYEKIGVDAALVITPSFYKSSMTDEVLKKHYLKVADESKMPIILYSVPSNTGIEITADTAISLSKHPNIIGLKDSGGDITKLTRIVAETRYNNFQVLAGSAGFLLPALQIGCVGGVCASANCLPDPLVQLFEEFQNHGSSETALQLQARLILPNGAVTRLGGVPALKHMMDVFGLYGGPVRSPLIPLNEDEKTKVEKIFRNSNFLD